MLKNIYLIGMIKGVAAPPLELKDGGPRYKDDAALLLPKSLFSVKKRDNPSL